MSLSDENSLSRDDLQRIAEDPTSSPAEREKALELLRGLGPSSQLDALWTSVLHPFELQQFRADILSYADDPNLFALLGETEVNDANLAHEALSVLRGTLTLDKLGLPEGSDLLDRLRAVQTNLEAFIRRDQFRYLFEWALHRGEEIDPTKLLPEALEVWREMQAAK